MNFGEALEAMKAENKITREEGTYIKTTRIEGSIAYTLPFAFLKCSENEPPKPYKFSDEDILAEDWEIFEDHNFKLGEKVMYGDVDCKITRIDTMFCDVQWIFAVTKNGDTIRDYPTRFRKIDIEGVNEKYKKWLKMCIDDSNKKIEEYLKEKDYTSAGKSQECVETYEYCLNMFCFFEEKDDSLR